MILSVLCVTKAERHSWPFLHMMGNLAHLLFGELVLAADGDEAVQTLRKGALFAEVVPVKSAGFMESVLDQAILACKGDYILRLDDDEAASVEMVHWLLDGRFLATDHWKFPRRHLWPDASQYITTPPLWPDVQTRLSVRTKAGGRPTPHAGSPFGGGELATCPIDHYKFLVKSREEREATAAKWHGGAMEPFSLPETLPSIETERIRP